MKKNYTLSIFISTCKPSVYNLLILMVLCPFYAALQAQSWQWGKSGGSIANTTTDESAESLVTDADGNVYLLAPVGNSGLTIDGIPLESNNQGNSTDCMIASFSCTGAYRWANIIGGASTDFARNLKTDAQGNIYVAGKVIRGSETLPVEFESQSDNDTILPYSVQDNEHKRSLFLVKYNADGELQWLQMPQPEDISLTDAFSNTFSFDVDIDAQGNIYWLCLIPPGVYANGAFTNTAEGKNLFIFKYDSNGDFVEATPLEMEIEFTLPYFKMARNHINGNFYIGGSRSIETAPFTIGGEIVEGTMYLAAFNATGSFEWMHENNPELPAYIDDMHIDNDGIIYLTGGVADGDTFAGETFNADTDNGFPYILKLDADGNVLWKTNATTTGLTRGYGITVTNSEVAITGGHGNIIWGDFNLSIEPNAGYDVMFARFNKTDGNIIALETLSSTFGTYDYGESLAADGFGNYYVGGKFRNVLNVADDQLLNGAQGYDFFVAKFGSENCDCTLPEPSFGFEQDSENELAFEFTYTGTTPYESILWIFGDEETSTEENPQYTYNEAGTYTVCVTVTNSCGSETQCTDINVTLSGKEFALGTVKIYPNPAQGHLTVNTQEDLSFSIYSVLGGLVQNGRIAAGKSEINLEKMVSGLYLLNLKNDDGEQKTIKIVKQ